MEREYQSACVSLLSIFITNAGLQVRNSKIDFMTLYRYLSRSLLIEFARTMLDIPP